MRPTIPSTSLPTEAAAGGAPPLTTPTPFPLRAQAPGTHQHAAWRAPRSRVEYFVFSLLAEMRGHKVQLYAILRDGALNRYPTVMVLEEKFMPSGGALANPNDRALVKGLEDKMI